MTLAAVQGTCQSVIVRECPTALGSLGHPLHLLQLYNLLPQELCEVWYAYLTGCGRSLLGRTLPCGAARQVGQNARLKVHCGLKA